MFRLHDKTFSFPNVYILEGGYERFFSEKSEYCTGAYIGIKNNKYAKTGAVDKCFNSFRNEFKVKEIPKYDMTQLNSALENKGENSEIILDSSEWLLQIADEYPSYLFINESISNIDSFINSPILDQANDLINCIRNLKKEEQPYKNTEKATKLLVTLKNDGWWGPYSVITYILKYETNTELRPDILPIDFNSGSNFEDQINLHYIEALLCQGRSYILLWSYIDFFHNELIELAEKYITPSGSRYQDVLQKIIRRKFNATEHLFIDASRSFGEMISKHFSAIKNTPNPDQILAAEKCSFVELDQVNRKIAPDQFWLNDKVCEFNDNYNNIEVADKFSSDCLKEASRFETVVLTPVNQGQNKAWMKKGPSMSKLLRTEGKEYNKANRMEKGFVNKK